MKKYQKYKDSGIEWIGEVPKHWNVRRLKDVLKDKVTDGPHETPSFIDEGIPFLSVDSIQDGELVFENCRYISVEDFEKYKVKCYPKKDDILMGKAASVGKIARVKVKFEFSVWSPLALLRPDLNKVTPIFLEYSLKSSYMQYNIVLLSNINTQSNIGMKDIPRLKYSLPPFDEQIIISDFLNEATHKINKVIENKKKQIDLLNLNSLIKTTETVTNGSNQTSSKKNTQNRWLGSVPEAWTLIRLKYISNVQPSNVDKKSLDNETEVFLCNYVDVYKNEYIKSNLNFMKATATDNEIIKFKIDVDDVLITKDSETAEDIAISSLVKETKEKLVCGYHLCQIKTNNDILYGPFLFKLFQSDKFRAQFTYSANGVTRYGLSIRFFMNALVPLPSMNEQKEIAEFLEEYTSKTQQVVMQIKEEISKLDEYKKILINDVVTGKMKVTA